MINELVEGQRVVKAFGLEEEKLAEFDEVNDKLQQVAMKAAFFSSLTNPSTRLVNNIVYAEITLIGAFFTVSGGITIGQLSVFLNYASQYAKPFNEISSVVSRVAECDFLWNVFLIFWKRQIKCRKKIRQSARSVKVETRCVAFPVCAGQTTDQRSESEGEFW